MSSDPNSTDGFQPPGESSPLEAYREVSPEERERILREIDRAIGAGRGTREEKLQPQRPPRRGVLFPVVINVAALVLVAAGVLFLEEYFRLRKAGITLQSGQLFSAEAAVVETLKKESERQLAELRSQMQAQLAAERERLTAAGSSQAEIAARLQALQQAQEQSLQSSSLQAEQALRSLSAQSRTEQLWEDQVTGYYSSALDALEAGEPSGALRELSSLRALLSQEAPGVSPGLIERREVEGRIVAAMEELIRLKGAAESSAGPAAAEAGARQLVEPVTAEAAAAAAAESAAESAASQAEALVQELQQRLESSQAERRAKEREVAVLQDRTDRVAAQLRASEAGAADLAARLRASEEETRRLTAQLQAQRQETSRLSTGLADSEAKRAELAAAAQTDRARDYGQGREAALKDVMLYLAYLAGNDRDPQVEASLLAKSREEVLYQAVTREIRILMAGGSGTGQPASPYVFLGVVSAVAAGRVTIEPMIEMEVPAGAAVQIRRMSDLQQESVVAQGKVQQVRGGKVVATLEGGGRSAATPELKDMVYVEVR
jgi:septal ring factor EnvC (AmiA/AmiB activator)